MSEFEARPQVSMLHDLDDSHLRLTSSAQVRPMSSPTAARVVVHAVGPVDTFRRDLPSIWTGSGLPPSWREADATPIRQRSRLCQPSEAYATDCRERRCAPPRLRARNPVDALEAAEGAWARPPRGDVGRSLRLRTIVKVTIHRWSSLPAGVESRVMISVSVPA